MSIYSITMGAMGKNYHLLIKITVVIDIKACPLRKPPSEFNNYLSEII